MRSRIRLVVAAAVLLSVGSVSPTLAQQQPPDIRGSYPVGGVVSIYDCTFEGSEITVPFAAFLTITTQDGNAFSGEIGVPNQVTDITLDGHVSSEGSIEGTWILVNDPVPAGELNDQVFSGEIVNGKVEVELTATIGNEAASCAYRIALASEAAVLTWSPPDPNAATELPPPRTLTIAPLPQPGATAAVAEAPREGQVTGYNVYRSSTPNVATTPENLFTSVPAAQTSAPTPVGSSGSFFVVTATYDAGESGPSNEVSGGVPAATVTSVKVSATKIKASGTDFSSQVQVFVDGIPFAAPAKVKAGKKVVQKGALLGGQTLGQYITSGKTVAITFRNANGGVATYVYSKP